MTPEIRSPLPAEWAACRLLLPDSFGGAPAPETLVATDSETGRLAGVAAFRRGKERIEEVRVHVIRGQRRKGVGRELLQKIRGIAAAAGSTEIHARAEVREEPDAEAFLLANGFQRKHELLTAEGDLEPLRGVLGRIAEQVRVSRKIPAGAELVEAAAASHEQLARLYGEHIAAAAGFHPAYIQPAFGDERMAGSSALLVDGVAKGLLLGECDPRRQLLTVHARVVAPGYRRNWANCLLMVRTLEIAWARGVRRVRFEIPGGNADTLKLAWRANARIVHASAWFVGRP